MRPSIVLFGDLIAEEAFGEGGWAPTSPTTTLAPPTSCSAATASGYNTRWASRVAHRAVAAIPGAAVSAVTVFFSSNDAALPDRACTLQHVPLDEYKDNLRAICDLLRKRWPSVVVILLTPPLVDEDRLLGP